MVLLQAQVLTAAEIYSSYTSILLYMLRTISFLLVIFICPVPFDITQGFIEEEQDQESAERPTKSLLELANVPEGAPALPSWHIERGDVMQDLCNGLRHVGWPRVLGLVGDSGSGKTTAASEVVRTKEMRELFHDGILWLPVNKGGKDRLPTLMRQLASMMHEEVMRSTGRAPTESENTTSFIRKLMEGGYKGEGLRCLVVADDTWEPEVIAKLQETTIWVLVTTHDEKLVTNSGGKVVALGDFSEDDSRLVLREAAELRKEVALPDAATELVELCGRFAMDLVSVGRWGTIRGNEDLSAWSDAAVAIRAELEGAKMDVESDTAAGGTRAKQRMAVLRAGLHILGTVNEQARWLYVALAVMPHGHTFTAQDAAMLLNDGPFATVDGEAAEAAAEEALHTLEQWAIVATAEGGPGGKYRIHDAHSNVARYSLKDHADIRRSAVRTWVEHLSSLEVVKTTEVHVLIGLWHTVELVRGEGWASRRPYAMPLARMATSDPVVCRESLEAVVNFHFANGELKTEYEFRQQLLEFEQKTLGPAHPRVLNTLTRLADCAIGTGEADIAQEWYRKAESTSFNVAFHMQDGFYKDDQEVIESLKSLAWSMMQFEEWSRAERILRRALDLQETTLAQDSVKLANTLYYLGRCVREAGNADGQAEDILLRAMSILQKKRRPDHWLTILTQEQLELCERDAEGP